jgi:hypothetical protein
MNELSIEQIQKVLGWSYPTALDWAKENGRMDGRKWMVSADTVYEKIYLRHQEVAESENMFFAICPAYSVPFVSF